MILISLLVVALVLTLSSMRGQGFIKWNRLNDTVFYLTATVTNHRKNLQIRPERSNL